jgi:hypothetical protein
VTEPDGNASNLMGRRLSGKFQESEGMADSASPFSPDPSMPIFTCSDSPLPCSEYGSNVFPKGSHAGSLVPSMAVLEGGGSFKNGAWWKVIKLLGHSL